MTNDILVCPNCGGRLLKRGAVKRLIRTDYGVKKFIKIKRYSCKNCGKWHRQFPDYIVPYKQYTRPIIEGFVNDILSVEDFRFEDFPSECTIFRWKKSRGGLSVKSRKKNK